MCVPGEDGMSTVSMNRRAQQAAYFSIKSDTDPLWSLQSRLYNFTNTKTNYNMSEEGQEPFTIIQYNVDDEYTPHCDGLCDGADFVSKGRVVTALMYCKVSKAYYIYLFNKLNFLFSVCN